MAESKQNVTILLDRLYNLRGEDNVLIKETEERIETTLARIANIEQAIAESKANQEEQEQSLSLFLQQKSTFETAFAGLTDESFSALANIDINLEIGTLMSTIQTKSPVFIKSLMDKIEKIKTEITSFEIEKDQSTEELAELRKKVVVHNEHRNQLVSLLEQSLSSQEIERESLTASFVKRVLGSFEVFTADEVTKLTKLIMFPDEGLYEYDRGYEERVAKGLIGLVEEEEPAIPPLGIVEEAAPEAEEPVEAPEEVSLTESGGVPTIVSQDGQIELNVNKIGTIKNDDPVAEHSNNQVEEEPAPEVEEPAPVEDEYEGPPVVLNFQQIEDADLDAIVSAPVVEVADENADIEKENVVANETGVVEAPAPVIELEPENKEEFDTTEVKAFLNRVGLDINLFEQNNTVPVLDILKKIAEADEELVERNYEILRSINLDSEAYKMRLNHMYITDPDFSKKVTLLRAKNITEQKIQSMIKDTNSGLRVPFDDVEKRIQAVENLHGKVDETNIFLICKDVSKYEENIETLLRYGIDIDDKEARNHMAVLFESLYIPSNVEILKNYIISILKSNGKYALSVFWKKPQDLLNDIDDLIEAGLENVIATHPEVLTIRDSSLISRVKYCESKGKPVFTDDMRSEPCDYVLKPDRFRKEFNYPTDVAQLVDRKETNDRLVDVIGNSDYIEILMNTLDDYYSTTESYATPEVVDSMKEHFENLSHYLEDNASSELVGKYTYKVNGVYICKNKLERNIAIILNTLAAAKQPILGVEREIVLVSALYNSRLTEEELKKVAESCLGFNQAAQEVKL